MARHNVVLSPHFDDAVLSLGGLLAKEGGSSTVVTFFAGKPASPRVTPWDLSSGFFNSDQAYQARYQENARALELLGISQEQTINLEHLDQQYRVNVFNTADDESLPERLLQDLLSLLQSHESQELNLYAPGLEMHEDHRLIKQTLLAALPYLTGQNVRCFLYQDLPYACTLSEEKLQKHKVTSVPDAEIVTVSLSRDQILKKMAAIMLYRSQILPLELYVGGNLSSRITEFSSSQARLFDVGAEYCEVVYRIM